MRVAIIGGGAVGLLFAARLVLGGLDVRLVTRGAEQADVLRRKGAILRTLDGEERAVLLRAVPFDGRLPEADVYLLAVKQADVATVLKAFASIPPAARVIALQNGMGHRELLEQAVSREQLFFGINTEGARRLSLAEVEHTGRGMVQIGPWDRRTQRDERVAAFVEAANRCGIDARCVAETASLAWRKLLANALINPLTAVFDVTNGELLASPLTVELMRRLFAEASRVALAEGQKIGESDWQDILSICRNTSRNHSSMLQDLRKGRPTEIEAINGYIARKGAEYGIPTPMHETIRRTVLLKSGLRLAKGEVCRDRSG